MERMRYLEHFRAHDHQAESCFGSIATGTTRDHTSSTRSRSHRPSSESGPLEIRRIPDTSEIKWRPVRGRTLAEIAGPSGPSIRFGKARRGPESRCHLRIRRDSTRPCGRTSSSIPETPAATLPSSQPPRSIDDWCTEQGPTSVTRTTDSELTWPLCDEFPSNQPACRARPQS